MNGAVVPHVLLAASGDNQLSVSADERHGNDDVMQSAYIPRTVWLVIGAKALLSADGAKTINY